MKKSPKTICKTTSMIKILNDLLTGADNETQDIGRWFAALSGAAGVFLQGWSVIVHHVPFDMQSFGVGVGSLAAGIGAMIKLKENSEPRAK